MTEPVRISVPSLGAASPLGADGGAFSPALVTRMLCSVQADLQAVRAESARATEATAGLGAKLDAMVTLLERIAAGVEASAAKTAEAMQTMIEATKTLNLRGWALEHRMEAIFPAVVGATAAIEADTQARTGEGPAPK